MASEAISANELWNPTSERVQPLSQEAMASILMEVTKNAGGEAPEFMLINPWDLSTLVGMLCASPWHFRAKMRSYGLNGLDMQRQLIAWRKDHPRRRGMKCGVWVRKAK